MTSEDQDILAKISKLAGMFNATTYPFAKDREWTDRLEGQINRHKNEQHATHTLHSQVGVQPPNNRRI